MKVSFDGGPSHYARAISVVIKATTEVRRPASQPDRPDEAGRRAKSGRRSVHTPNHV